MEFLQSLGFDGSIDGDNFEVAFASAEDAILEKQAQGYFLTAYCHHQGLQIWFRHLLGKQTSTYDFHWRSNFLHSCRIIRRNFSGQTDHPFTLFEAFLPLSGMSIDNDSFVEEELAGLSFFFHTPDTPAYAHLSTPFMARLDLTAISTGKILHIPHEKTRDISGEELSSLLISLMDMQSVDGESLPLLGVGGIVRAKRDAINPVTGVKICILTVQISRNYLDVVARADSKVARTPVGKRLITLCMMSARILEVWRDGEEPLPFFMQCPIAGSQYRDPDLIKEELNFWDELQLTREPDNPYDASAVAVYNRKGQKIGFVPRKQNSQLAAEMDRGECFIAYLSDSRLEYGEERYTMRIYRC